MKRLQNRITTALSVLCGLLSLIVVAGITLLDPEGIVIAGDTTDDNIELPVDANVRFIAKSLDNFTAILERPLLYEDRRMPLLPEAATLPMKPKEPLRLKLEGVAISSDQRIALLRNTSDNQLLQLAEGMSYNGWTLETLNSTRVTFLRGEDITEIAMEKAISRQARRRY